MNQANEPGPVPVLSSDLSTVSWANNYAEIVNKAEMVRQSFLSSGVKINPGSALSRLLAQAGVVSDAWDNGRDPPLQALCEAAQVNRLSRRCDCSSS